MPAIPVYIISGFLGSGKTTAILNLLDQKIPDECWAIVVNEYGKISIDGETFREKSSLGTIFDISGGCICCTSKLYLKENLSKIIHSGEFDRVFIEPTGLGGIEMVLEISNQFQELKPMPIVCMVDLVLFENKRLVKNWIYRDQIFRSDLVFFSKCDLLMDLNVLAESIEKFKTEFPAKKFCFPADRLTISLLDSYSGDTKGDLEFNRPIPESLKLNKDNYTSNYYSFGPERITEAGKIRNFILANPQIIRVKGFIHTPEGWFLFNYSLSDLILKPCLQKEQNEFVIISENCNFNELNMEGFFL